MPKGTRYPSEATVSRDEATGRLIRQITAHPSIHHHPFFMIPAYDDGMRRLTFISHRTGKPQLFAELRSSGELLQLTDRDDLNEWSVHPSHDGRFVYFTAGSGAWRIDTDTLEEERLYDFGDAALREGGMVGAGMGTTALSRDDRWWAFRYSLGEASCLAVMDTLAGTTETILRRDVVAHIQFCPDDSGLLFYAGPLTDRVWAIRRDGSDNRRLYGRDVRKKEWITHEVWLPGTRELAFIDWPHGIRSVCADTGQERTIAGFNAWHAASNPQGTLLVADTNFPDRGLYLVDSSGAADPRLLCLSLSSNRGDHWNGTFPYDDGPIQVYAPQHTHPHPSFSADGRYVVFTSDRSGFAQLYEIEVPEGDGETT